MVKNNILVEIYQLFQPLSTSRTDFKKQVVYVKDIELPYSPVTLAKARRALGIATERIAGKPAWLAPTININHAIRGSITSRGKTWENRKDRMGERLTPYLKEFFIHQGLAVKCSTAKEEFKQWRIERHAGRGFPYYAFSRAVKNLELEKVNYNQEKYYLLRRNSHFNEQMDPLFERLTELVEGLFEELPRGVKSIPEEKIIAACQSGNHYYHKVAVLNVGGFGKDERGNWYEEGIKRDGEEE